MEAFYYVALLLPVVIGTSYFFNYYLVPRYLFTRKFMQFGLYSFYMIVVSLCLELLASVVAMLVIIYFGINETGPLVTDVFTLAVILYFIVLFKSFILLIKHYFVDQRAIHELEEKQSKLDRGYFNVRSNRRVSKILFASVLYIESLADYIVIHMENGQKVKSKEKISHIERELPEPFLRIHRSFIVNRAKITSFTREEVLLGDIELAIGRTYKTQVSKILK